MKKPELLITIGSSGDPLLRGACSLCPDVTFIFPANTEENHKLMLRHLTSIPERST